MLKINSNAFFYRPATMLGILLCMWLGCVAGSSATGKESPVKVVKKFLTWYAQNLHRLQTINLVGAAPLVANDTTQYYVVNFAGTEQYLQELRGSGCISGTYVENWRNYFSRADDNFRQNPQFEGPPDFFDYDLVMQSQDFEEDFDSPNRQQVVKEWQKKNNAGVVVFFPYSGLKLSYRLSFTEGKWQIDDIENISNQ
ncbi:hypothetical protein C7N43_06335 [Sphingobacteriales bacterium UPWRP_1]|nr:hypothetical protein BVG80_12010 [Sphingobacteriales bacterium TSM_CSM]PSJ77947.1 hypothetical protein C7N43_06335 [Sphingobacteriales bacterium UPWRP_1]